MRKRKEIELIDVAIPSDRRVKDKEQEIIERHEKLMKNCKIVEDEKSYSNSCCDWNTMMHFKSLRKLYGEDWD